MKMHEPLHPGTFIREVYLKPLGIPASRAALHLGVVPSTFGRLLLGTSDVTPIMAIRLSGVFGRTAESWLAMQNHFDLWKHAKVIKVNKIKPMPEVVKATNAAGRAARRAGPKS